MSTERFLSINQLSKIYNLPDITLYRDFRKLLSSNVGVAGTDYIKYFKDPQMNKFEWGIDPVWFENSVDRKLKIFVENNPIEIEHIDTNFSSYDRQNRGEPIAPNVEDENRDETGDENSKNIHSWLMEKIDELTEMLKNFQILIAQKDKQIETLQKSMFLLEKPVITTAEHSYQNDDLNSTNDDMSTPASPVDDSTLNETVLDEVDDNVADHELHEDIAPYEMSEHAHNELLTSLNTLEKIITDDGQIDTTEIERSRDMDTDSWEDENSRNVPDNPNVRGGETDPRILDSDNEPIDSSLTDVDTFTRIARERGF